MGKDITISLIVSFLFKLSTGRDEFSDHPLLLDHLSKGLTKFISANKM